MTLNYLPSLELVCHGIVIILTGGGGIIISFELAPKTVSGDTTANGPQEGSSR